MEICSTNLWTGGVDITQETVTITKAEYEDLLDEVEFLNCLRACGVDNWQGYSDANGIYEEADEEWSYTMMYHESGEKLMK